MFASDLKHPSPSLAKKLNQLYTLSRGNRIDLSFRKPYLDLLEKFGNPHLNLPPTIHVAGTNGKGSTIAFMRAILQAQGHSVHAYTSPHLHQFNERIVLAGHMIDNDSLEALIDEALTLNRGNDITFFEITTAMAFAAFARAPAGCLLLETGLGGRLDCTNVIPAAEATLITPISYDHTEFLGDTIESITSEKAGIIKHAAPCIIAKQTHETARTHLTHAAKEKHAPALHHGSDWVTQYADHDFTLHFRNETLTCPLPSLQGPHQIDNAAAAIVTLKTIQRFRHISDEAVIHGLTHASWPGRMENVTHHFKDITQNTWTILYDGGHNQAAGQIITQASQNAGHKTHIIIGMMNHKNPKTFLESIEAHAESLTLVPIPNEPQSYTPEELKTFTAHTNVKTASTIHQAVQIIVQDTPTPAQIIITGSLYLAAHITKPS